jgi:hypothetical protein
MSNNFEKKYKKYKIKYLQLKTPIILNLMWINDGIIDSPYIFCLEHKKINVASNISKWLEMDYKIFFWYDSHYITPEQLSTTKEYFKECDISFFDIRNIITGYDKILPCKIYLKADFYRLVVLKHLLENKPWFKYFIYSDIIIPPIEKDKIINNGVLNKYQMIFSSPVSGEFARGFENSLIIFKNETVLKKNLINFINIAYNSIFISKSFFKSGDIYKCEDFKSNSNQIFYQILKALIYIQIQKIFYKEDIDSGDIEYLIKNTGDEESTDKFFKDKNTSHFNDTTELPLIFEKTVNLTPYSKRIFERKKDKYLSEGNSDEAFKIEEILSLGSYKETLSASYLYPVIKISRLQASGVY